MAASAPKPVALPAELDRIDGWIAEGRAQARTPEGGGATVARELFEP